MKRLIRSSLPGIRSAAEAENACKVYACDAIFNYIDQTIDPLLLYDFTIGGPQPSAGVNDTIPNSKSTSYDLTVKSGYTSNNPTYPSKIDVCTGYMWLMQEAGSNINNLTGLQGIGQADGITIGFIFSDLTSLGSIAIEAEVTDTLKATNPNKRNFGYYIDESFRIICGIDRLHTLSGLITEGTHTVILVYRKNPTITVWDSNDISSELEVWVDGVKAWSAQESAALPPISEDYDDLDTFELSSTGGEGAIAYAFYDNKPWAAQHIAGLQAAYEQNFLTYVDPDPLCVRSACKVYACDEFTNFLLSVNQQLIYDFTAGGPIPSSGVNDVIYNIGTGTGTDQTLVAGWDKHVPEGTSPWGNCTGYMWQFLDNSSNDGHARSTESRRNDFFGTHGSKTLGYTMGMVIYNSGGRGFAFENKIYDTFQVDLLKLFGIALNNADGTTLTVTHHNNTFNVANAVTVGSMHHIVVTYWRDQSATDWNGTADQNFSDLFLYVDGVKIWDAKQDYYGGAYGVHTGDFTDLWETESVMYNDAQGFVAYTWHDGTPWSDDRVADAHQAYLQTFTDYVDPDPLCGVNVPTPNEDPVPERFALVWNFEDNNFTWMDASVIDAGELLPVPCMDYGPEPGWQATWGALLNHGIIWGTEGDTGLDNLMAGTDEWGNALGPTGWDDFYYAGKELSMFWLSDAGVSESDQVVDKSGLKEYFAERVAMDFDDALGTTSNTYKHVRQLYPLLQSPESGPMNTYRFSIGWSANLMDDPDYQPERTIYLNKSDYSGKHKIDTRSTGRYMAMKWDFTYTDEIAMTGVDIDIEESHGR